MDKAVISERVKQMVKEGHIHPDALPIDRGSWRKAVRIFALFIVLHIVMTFFVLFR